MNDTLVSGGSDGFVRVWSLKTMALVHGIAAADNSITGLEFNHSRILTGSSDGRVKVWDTITGELVRELGEPAEAVWRVSMSEGMAVVICSRKERVSLEVRIPFVWAIGSY